MGLLDIIGPVHDYHQLRDAEQLRQDKVNAFNANFSPDSIHAMAQDDPDAALAYADQNTARLQAQRDASRNNTLGMLNTTRQFLRGLPPGVDPTDALAKVAPALQESGMDPAHIQMFGDALKQNPNLVMDDKAYDEYVKGQYDTKIAPIGSHVIRGGQVIDRVPYAMKSVTTPAGATSVPFDPNSGQFVTGGGGGPQPGVGVSPASGGAYSGPPLTAQALLPLIRQQESSGDYTAVNKDTGAAGAYGIMPATGQKLAARIGAAWRPDMMTQDTPAARRYQDAMGAAAAQDSIDAAGADNPQGVFSHYYSGSPTAYTRPDGNPHTAKYVQDMMTRVGGGDPRAASGAPAAGPVITPTSVSAPAKPTAATSQKRTMTPEEVKAAGLPDGTAAQVDGNGGVHVLSKPSATQVSKDAQNETTFQNGYAHAKAGVADMRSKLTQILNDPGLGAATGLVGSVLGRLPGTHAKYLQGIANQINAQKLVTQLTSLKTADGNPLGSRILKMEAEQIPKLLANLDFSQSPDDFRTAIRQGLAAADAMDHELDAAAAQHHPAAGSPVYATNPKTGHRVMWDGHSWKDAQ